MIHKEYLSAITRALSAIAEDGESICRAADAVAEVIRRDGIIYVFGCGHSHLIGLDSFYRAGGLASVCAIQDADLMLFNGAAKSSVMEHMTGIAPEILRRYAITDRDILFVVSTSGKNAVPVEMACEARRRGVFVVGIASSAYADAKPEYPAGLLRDTVDVFLDNRVPHGDACMSLPHTEVKMGSISTLTGVYLLQSVLLTAAEKCAQEGVELPLYISGHVVGGAAHNKDIIDRYIPRIKHL